MSVMFYIVIIANKTALLQNPINILYIVYIVNYTFVVLDEFSSYN